MRFLTQFSRIFVGILFIISGLIKANDTLGFSYKLIEYFEIFGTEFLNDYAVAFSMFICIFEIASGVALLLGNFVKINAWLLLLLIVFFTLLTGYSAITGKVTDCGCFGDAVKLKPIESFLKDVVLLVLIIFIFIGQQHIKPLFNLVVVNIALFVATLVATFFTFYTFMFLPVKDFLPYKIGNNIYDLTLIPEGAPRDEVEMVFEYSKDGKVFEFKAEELPEDIDAYTFVDRKDKVIKEGFKPPIHDFKVYDANGIEFTDSLFKVKGYQLFVIQTKLENSRTASLASIKDLSEDWIKAGLPLWALTASGPEEAFNFQKQYQLPFAYYNMDAIPLKSMVRSNPAIMLMKDNVVIKKWGAYNLPSMSTLQKYMN
jgi:uncharacterized membrane protein YphA (DoxX/SURF4 family)